MVAILVVAVFLVAIVINSIKILKEYERGVMFTLGRYTGTKGPGLILVVPVLQQMTRVDLRTVVLDVPKQDVIARDNVSVKVNAVVYFRVVDPGKAIIQVANPFEATMPAVTDISTQVRFRKQQEMEKGAARLRQDGFKGPVKVLTTCPSCLQGLKRYDDDADTDADYVVVEIARHLLGENWMPEYVSRANDGGIERVLV